MKDKELEEQIRDISFETISEMLDNPDSYGLYPTTKAFERIDREVLNLIAQERRKARIDEWGLISEALHSANIEGELYLNKIRNDRIAELKEDKEA